MKVSTLACAMFCGSVLLAGSGFAETNLQKSKIVRPQHAGQADSDAPDESQATAGSSLLESRGYKPHDIELISEARRIAVMTGELPNKALVNRWSSEESSLRRQVGDSLFDALLFASNFPNRVEIISVEPGAGAAMAGLLPGDGILAYGGIRVFTRFDLGATVLRVTQAMGTTLSRKTVTVVITRDANLFEARVPPGMAALGIETRTVLREPIKWAPRVSAPTQRD